MFHVSTSEENSIIHQVINMVQQIRSLDTPGERRFFGRESGIETTKRHTYLLNKPSRKSQEKEMFSFAVESTPNLSRLWLLPSHHLSFSTFQIFNTPSPLSFSFSFSFSYDISSFFFVGTKQFSSKASLPTPNNKEISKYLDAVFLTVKPLNGFIFSKPSTPLPQTMIVIFKSYVACGLDGFVEQENHGKR